MSEKPSGSCIKVNGVPLLPPIISAAMSGYIKKVKEEAISIEKKLSEKKKMKRTVVNMWTEVNQELDLLDCGQELSLTEWTGSSASQVHLSDSSTQTIDMSQDVDDEQVVISMGEFHTIGFNAWTQMSKYIMDCKREPNEYLILMHSSDINSSVQIELDKKETLEIIRQKSPMKREKPVVPTTKKLSGKTKGQSSTKGKEKWTSCPSHLGSSSTVRSELVTKEPKERKAIESASEEWKRWMSLPDVYDMTSTTVECSQNSKQYTQKVDVPDVTDRTSKLEISPDRQKSYTLVKPSKYLIDYARKRAYGISTTSLSPQRHKSYTVIEPSKFLLDYVETKGYVGPVEESIPEQSTSGSSTMLPTENQRIMHSSCEKCKEVYCLCGEGEELPASNETKELENRAATKINAAARGYLVRKLMKTRHVQQCIDTIRYTLQCHLALSSKSNEDSDESDAELHLRIMRQLLSSCEEFYDTFFGITKSEQLKIIASDRSLQSE